MFYRPVALIASSSVFAGSRPTAAQKSMYSPMSGLPFFWSRRSMIRGALTSSVRLRARSDGGSSMLYQASMTRFMSSLSSSVHSLASLGMTRIVGMLKSSNTPYDAMIDNMLDVANIADMLETANTKMTAGQIAIRIIEKTAAMKDLTQESLASKLGVTRQTVASRLFKRSMTLDDFIDTAYAVGADPSRVIADSVRIKRQAEGVE